MKMKFTKNNKNKKVLSENILVSSKTNEKEPVVATPILKAKKKWTNVLKIGLAVALFLVSFSSYFYFGLQHLTQFETADEHLWISNLYTGRIQKYWNAVDQKDWKNTRINDKPGITLALISGIGMRYEKNVKEKIVFKEKIWTAYNPAKTEEVYFIYRLPILIFNGLMSVFFFVSLWRLTRKMWLALATTSFILLSPILIGISQIINPDALLWVFSFASVISFSLFLKNYKIIDGFFSALFLALSLLSKYVALIFIPFFFIMLTGYLLFNQTKLTEQKIFRRYAFWLSLGYFLIIIGATGLFALGMPAAIVDPKVIYSLVFRFSSMKNILILCTALNAFILLDSIILKSFIVEFVTKKLQILKTIIPKVLYISLAILTIVVIVNWSVGNNFLKTPIFEIGGGKRDYILTLPFYKTLAIQARPLIFSLTPITLFLMLFIWIKSIFRKSAYDFIIFITSIFFVVFFVAVTQQKLQLHVRYAVVLYPFALLLAGFGFYELTKKLKMIYISFIFLLVVAIGVLNVWQIKPFYFNYANAFLPKDSLISTSWGYGGYEAVEFLKSTGEDTKEMRIWTNYYGVCQFFDGHCYMEGSVKWVKKKSLATFDYVILDKDGMDKNKAGLKRINEVFPTDNPIWKLEIDDRPGNFVYVYKNPLKQ